MKLYPEDFEQGVQAFFHKQASDIFDLSGQAIFPRIESQTKWKFARANSHLRLSDGTHVYNFHLPDGEKHDADFPAVRAADIPLTQFQDAADGHGVAQVHRADPGSIYFTLQDGKSNPTYTIKHTGGDTWKVSPKKKTKVIHDVHPEEILKAAAELVKKGFNLPQAAYGLANSAVKQLGNAPHALKHLMMSPTNIDSKTMSAFGHNFNVPAPMVAAGLGLGAGAVYDQGRRMLYNTREENANESAGQRIARYAAPAALMGGLNYGENNMFPNYRVLNEAGLV